jgi:hypothetical protein
MVDEYELLAKELVSESQATASSNRRPSDSVYIDPGIDHQQWVVGVNDTFRATGKTVSMIPAGVYKFCVDGHGIVYIEKVKVVTDDLLILPDSANARVIAGMEKFWKSKDRYIARKLLYKRGVVLWGPPGSGKTATLQLLMKQLVDVGGIIIISGHPALTVEGLKTVRRIEPTRNIITVFEDIDETIDQYGEHELLALLDGESQISNVCNIATTNFPGKLGARIINRPSRFDERIYVGMPSPEAREVYLRNVAPEIDGWTLSRWVADTDKMSVAHLKELAVAILCLDQDYDDVIKRLRSMKVKPRDIDGFGDSGGVGFDSSRATTPPSPMHSQGGRLR